jgi:IclR family transcriptional regulator, KDG regulon repressor
MTRKGIRNDDPFNNRSVMRAFQILSSFNFERREMGLSELARALDLPKATVYRLASTLVFCHFLKYDEGSKHDSLGHKLFELGSVVFASFSLRKTASAQVGLSL